MTPLLSLQQLYQLAETLGFLSIPNSPLLEHISTKEQVQLELHPDYPDTPQLIVSPLQPIQQLQPELQYRPLQPHDLEFYRWLEQQPPKQQQLHLDKAVKYRFQMYQLQLDPRFAFIFYYFLELTKNSQFYPGYLIKQLYPEVAYFLGNLKQPTHHLTLYAKQVYDQL